MKNWNSLSPAHKDYINQRFKDYGVTGEEAFNNIFLFPKKIKIEKSEKIIKYLKSSNIFRVMPSNEYPELTKYEYNLYLTDSKTDINYEIINSYIKNDSGNNLNDLIDKFKEQVELHNDLLGNTKFGLGLKNTNAIRKIITGEILLNEYPRYTIIQHQETHSRCSIIGACKSSGLPIILSGEASYLLYKSKSKISNGYEIAWNIASNPTYLKVIENSTIITSPIIENSNIAIKKASKLTQDIIKHETIQNLIKTTQESTHSINFEILKIKNKLQKLINKKSNY